MGKRILTVLLAVMVLATFMPVETFAAYRSDAKKSDTDSVEILIPKGRCANVKYRNTPARSKIKHSEEDLDIVKQELAEYSAETLNTIQGREDEYYPDVLDAIMKCNDEYLKRVNEAKDLYDLVDEGLFGLEINSDIYRYIQAIEYLVNMDIQEVYSKKDFSRLKKELATGFNDIHGGEKGKYFYSEYYWPKYNSIIVDYTSRIKSAKNYYDYALLLVDLEIDDLYFKDDEYADYDEDDGLEYKVIGLSSDTKSVITYGVEWFGEEYEFRDIYDIEDTKEIRKMFLGWVDKCLEDAESLGIKDAKTKYKKKTDAVKKQIKSEVDCNIMYKDYEIFAYEIYDIVEEMNKDEDLVNFGDVLRLHKKMRKAFLKYKKGDYSVENFQMLEDIYNDYTNKIAGYTYQFQLDDPIVSKMTKKMDKVLTLKEEQKLAKKKLQQLKNKRIKQLKKLAHNKKYDQKKSIPLMKKGVKKIKAAKTKEKVETIYVTYRDKIKKTKKK